MAAISESWFIWDAAIRTVRSLVAQMSERSEIRQHRDLLTRVPIPMVVSLDEHAGPARDSGPVPGYICTKSRPESMTQIGASGASRNRRCGMRDLGRNAVLPVDDHLRSVWSVRLPLMRRQWHSGFAGCCAFRERDYRMQRRSNKYGWALDGPPAQAGTQRRPVAVAVDDVCVGH